MKNLGKTIVIATVTTLFVTAFTTSNFSHQDRVYAQATNSNETTVAQVVIVGKRMTALEKAQYDHEMVAQGSAQPEPKPVHVAVK